MTITAVNAVRVEIPACGDLPRSSGSAEVGRFVLVRIDTSPGLVGWGGCFAYRNPAAVCSAVKRLGSTLVGDRIMEPGSLLARLEHVAALSFATDRFAVAGLELACWDLAGKLRGVPVSSLFSETNGRPHRAKIPAYASLPRYDRPADVARAAELAAADGITAIKLHQVDLASVAAVRSAVGSGIDIMLDVNGAWTADEAIDRCRLLERMDLAWIEEPITPLDDFAGLARLRGRTRIRVAAGENEWLPATYQEMVAQRAVDIVQPSLLKVGGLLRFANIARIVIDAGLAFMPHAYYLGPGFAASLHFAAGCEQVTLLEVPSAALTAAIAEEPPVFLRGSLTVPSQPGLGADPDLDVLDRYTARG